MVVSSDNFIDVGEPDDPHGQHPDAASQPHLKVAAEDGHLLGSNAANEAGVAAVAGTGPAAAPSIKPYTDLPYSFAKRHGVLLEANAENKLVMVQRNGVSMMAIAEASRKAGQKVTTETVTDDEFDARLTRHYEGETGQAIDIMDDLGEGMDLEQLADALPEPEDLLESTDDAPVIRLINAMLSEAVRKQASDIHIEPFEKRLSVRYRVDGVMQKMLEPPRAIAPLDGKARHRRASPATGWPYRPDSSRTAGRCACLYPALGPW